MNLYGLLVLGVLSTGLFAAEAPQQVRGAQTVNTEQAAHLYDLGAVFVDVRPADQWRWGHIQGALHLPVAQGLNTLAQRNWPREVPLVVYCESDQCAAGAEAAKQLVRWGYARVFYYREGFFTWQMFDLPLNQSPEVLGFNALKKVAANAGPGL